MIVCRKCGKRRDGQLYPRRRVTPITFAERGCRFGVMAGMHPGWIEVEIAEPIVDRAQACRASVCEISDLNGRRFMRENQEPPAGGVSGEVDQDIDFVASNQLGRLLV